MPDSPESSTRKWEKALSLAMAVGGYYMKEFPTPWVKLPGGMLFVACCGWLIGLLLPRRRRWIAILTVLAVVGTVALQVRSMHVDSGTFTPSEVVALRSVLAKVAASTEDIGDAHLSGFSYLTTVRLVSVAADRAAYLMDVGTVRGARLSLYTTPDRRLVYRLTDNYGRENSLYAPIGSPEGLTLGNIVAISAEYGRGGGRTVMKLKVNGALVDRRDLPFEIEADLDIFPMSFGADVEGHNGAVFDNYVDITYANTLSAAAVREWGGWMAKVIEDHSPLPVRHFDGSGYIRVPPRAKR